LPWSMWAIMEKLRIFFIVRGFYALQIRESSALRAVQSMMSMAVFCLKRRILHYNQKARKQVIMQA
jgi:hypothetical protein